MVEEVLGGRGRSLPVPALPAGYGVRGVPTVSGPGDAAAAAAAGSASARASEDAEVAKYADANFDEFSGFNEQLFASGEYDAEDKEADMIYDAIDRRLASKRDGKRKRDDDEEDANTRMPQIARQFADIKRTLKDVTQEEWESIPEALDYSRQAKLRKQTDAREKFTAVTDDLIASHANTLLGQVNVVMDAGSGMDTPANGMGGTSSSAAAAAAAGLSTDLTSIGRARDKMLSMKLDRMSDSVSGQTVVDPKGYMTQLASTRVSSDTEVSDIKKARLLLRSVIQTNPRHGPGWIAAARLEKETGKISQARQIILKGCEMAPTNEDVWIEAAAMQTPANARAILAKAVQHLPTSVNIWLMAANLETEVEQQKAVLRRALEHLPTSVRLWKTAVELETPDDARIMLSRAVELVPQSVEMWLALASLESYEQARVVLNRARKAVPTDASIWISAAKLEEANGNAAHVDAIIARAVKSLAKASVVIDRDSWLNAAEECEKADAMATCQALVRHTIGLGVEELDRRLTWTNDCNVFEQKGAYGVARAIATHLCETFPSKKSVWMHAAQLERAHGTPESLDALLARAVTHVPHAEVLWLMRAKLKWTNGDVPGARAVLQQAFDSNKNSEEVWLAAVKVEFESQEFERARMLLSRAREAANTPRVWMKSALIERQLSSPSRERALLVDGLKRFPSSAKMHMMLGQLLHRQGEIDAARDAFKAGVKAVGAGNVDIWICYANFELQVGLGKAQVKTEAGAGNGAATAAKSEPVVKLENGAPPAVAPAAAGSVPSASQLLQANPYAKARAILESARLKIPHSPPLWLAAIRLELHAGQRKSAEWLLAKSLQDCPTGGALWAQAIAMDERPAKKRRSFEALERCNEDVHVLMAVAKLFWLDRKVAKARSWFARTLEADADLGDAWAWAYRFELEHGTPEQQQAILNRCAEAEPAHGELWCAVAKDDRNARLKAADILKLVVARLPNDVFYTLAPTPANA